MAHLTLKVEIEKKGYKLPLDTLLEFQVTETRRIQARVPSVEGEEDVWVSVKKNEIESFIFEPKEVDIESFI